MSETRPDKFELLRQKLDEIEREFKRIGYWSEEATDPFGHLSSGEDRTYLTASTFEGWLQFVFLPTARDRTQQRDLPSDSQVGLMALRQWNYHSHVPEAQDLIRLLSEFDSLVKALAKGS